MSPTAAELLSTLKARGVELEADGDLLRFRPRSAAEDLVPALRERKAELLRILSGRRGGAHWPDALPGLGRRESIALTRCARCLEHTFAAYGAMRYPVCRGCAQWLDNGPLSDYVDILTRLWPLHTSTDLDAIQTALQEQARLAEALGDDLARSVSRSEGARWYAATGLCPTCGERGEFHQPEDA